jgi:hypothetical protein
VNRILPSIALCLVAAQEPPPAVPRNRLPVLGTVGDLPPEKERVIVEATATGALAADGHAVDLDGLRQYLQPKADALREEAPPRTSRLHVVLRVDRSLRWGDLREVLRACADPRVRVYRVLFAAVPEDRGEEGAMASFLPVDTGDDSRTGESVIHGLPVHLAAARSSATPGSQVYGHLAGAFHGGEHGQYVASLDADPGVSAGAVLETMDALLRWGALGVTFRMALPTTKGGGIPEQSVGWPQVSVLGTRIEGFMGSEPALPAVARVQGRMAGQTAAPLSLPPDPEAGTGRRFSREVLAREGGSGTEGAVKAGLDWLARHQSAGGFWDADGFEANCRGTKCGGPGGPLYDPGVTGLALLAFQAAGETHKTPNFGQVVRSGLKYLKGIQDADGCFGPRTSNHYVYNHAIASLAMADVYGQTESPLFRQPAQDGLDFIQKCQNPYLAWRYGVKPKDNDTSVTAWMVWALDAGRAAGLSVDQDSLDGAKSWLDKVTDPATGRVGYTVRGNGPARPQELLDRFPSDRSESMTALGVLTRFHCGADRFDPWVKKGIDVLLKVPPTWSVRDGSIDFYYWHFGTMAMFEVGGDRWRKWNESMKEALVAHQRTGAEADARGSWDPLDPWATEEGRVGATALNTLTLETYYR